MKSSEVLNSSVSHQTSHRKISTAGKAHKTDALITVLGKDADTRLLYKSFNELLDLTEQLVGQNFFNDVAGFENVSEFHCMFRNFVSSNQSADNFVFNCRIAEKSIPLRVMILRTSEINQLEKRDILIVDIRRNPIVNL